MHHPWRTLIIAWLFLLTLGLIGIGWLYLKVFPSLTQPSLAPSPTPPNDAQFQAEVWDAMADLSDRVDTLEVQATATGKPQTTVINSTTTNTVTVPATPTSNGNGTGKVREVFLPIGGGNTDNRDWTNMTGAQIMFDPRKFGQIVSVRFEAAGYIIGGEVHARLIDVTNNVIYYNTELVFNQSSADWERSSSFTIPNSPVTYQVQLRSSSGEMAYLQDSRLVIETRY